MRTRVNGAQRLLRYSNPDSQFDGVATGTIDNNVARQIRQRAGTLVNFASSDNTDVAPTIDLDGPSYINSPGNYTFEAVYSCQNVQQYRWDVGPTPYSYNQTFISAGEYLNLSVNRNTAPQGVFFVKLTITFTNGQVLNVYKAVGYNSNSGGRVGSTEENSSVWEFKPIMPNPASNDVKLVFTIGAEVPVWVDLIDQQGRLVKHSNEGTLPPGQYTRTYSVNDLPRGIYFYRILADKFNKSQKVVIQK